MPTEFVRIVRGFETDSLIEIAECSGEIVIDLVVGLVLGPTDCLHGRTKIPTREPISEENVRTTQYDLRWRILRDVVLRYGVVDFTLLGLSDLVENLLSISVKALLCHGVG
jgi:hypothetical protein